MTFEPKYLVFTLVLASAISASVSAAQDGGEATLGKGGAAALAATHTVPPSWREVPPEVGGRPKSPPTGDVGSAGDTAETAGVPAAGPVKNPAVKVPDAPLVLAPPGEGSSNDESGKGARNVPGETAQGQEALPGVPANGGGEPAEAPKAPALANSPAPAAAPGAQGKAGGPDTRAEPLGSKGGGVDAEAKVAPGDTPGRGKERSTPAAAPAAVAASPGIKERAEGGKKTLSIGANPVRNVPEIERVDDDDGGGEGEGGASGKGPIGQANAPFRRGPRVQEPGLREETVRYVYVSRGSWLIKLLQPHIDRLAIHVIRADSSDVSAGYTELTRTFAYLCALIAADDGSEKMLRKVGEAVSIHRKAISALRLSWARKDEAVEKIFNDYIEATFFKDLNRDAVRIPAGGLSASEYRTLRETYADQLDANDGKPSDFPILGGK